MQKHVICVQDLSCFGKCSLTISMPILCSAGIQVTPLPTALLSTHTGGLGKPLIHDLQSDMRQIREHWNTLSFSVDAIYSGYVSDNAQLQEIEELFAQYPHCYHFVDPVMGDHGKLYASLPFDIRNKMRSLCQKADCITPNMTEAYALLQEPFRQGPYTKAEIKRILYALFDITQCDIVLTGVAFDDQTIGCAIYGKGKIDYMMQEKLPYTCHGSGDVFASALLGARLCDHSLIKACEIAMLFTSACLKLGYEQGLDERYGLPYEVLLAQYMQLCNIDKNCELLLREEWK